MKKEETVSPIKIRKVFHYPLGAVGKQIKLLNMKKSDKNAIDKKHR